MNILFDISVLGFSHTANKARTGIFRVAHNLAIGLLQERCLSVSFCAPASYLHYAESIEFLRSQSVIPLARFRASRYPGHDALQHWVTAGLKLISQHQRRFGPDHLSTKVLRTLRTIGNEGLSAIHLLYPDFLLDRGHLAGVDIYHSPFHGIPPHLRSPGQRMKFVLTVHDLIPIRFPHLFTGSNAEALRKTLASITPDDWVLCVSEATRRDLLAYRSDLDPARVCVSYLAASAAFHPCLDQEKKARAQKKYHLPVGAPYLLTVGTLEPRKNISRVILAFLRLCREERLGDLRLVLCGPTGWKYTDVVHPAGITPRERERIIFTGFVEDEDLATLYSGALAFVYPSLYEGFGLPPLEAMQCGTPVITSDVASLPEVVGDAGLMVAPTDTDALCQAMARVVTDHTLRQELSRRSLARAGAFSWQRCLATTVRCYQQAMAS